MSPEIMQALALALSDILGAEVPNTPEGIAAALDQLKAMLVPAAQMDALEEDEQEEVLEAAASIKSALGLDADASHAEAVSKIDALKAAITGANRSNGLNALATAVKGVENTKRFSPNPNATQPAGNGAVKSFNIGGKAEKPTLVGMLRDLKAGKSQSYQLGSTGGYLLRHEVATEIMPALRASVPLFEMGVDEYQIDGTESLTILKDSTTEFESYWVGEDTEIPESNERIGTITLQPKPLAVRVPIPNKFLANSTVNYESRVREKMTYRLTRGIMRAALLGSGGVEGSNTGGQPRGLINTTGVTNTELGSGNGATPVIDDLADCIGRVEDDDVELDETARWLIAPRTKRTFTKTADLDGLPILRQSWSAGEEKMILGHEYRTSTIVPKNITVGSSTDCSYIFFGVWRYLALAMSNQFEFMVNPYRLANYLQTEIIAHCYVDLAVLYAEAFEVVSGVRA